MSPPHLPSGSPRYYWIGYLRSSSSAGPAGFLQTVCGSPPYDYLDPRRHDGSPGLPYTAGADRASNPSVEPGKIVRSRFRWVSIRPVLFPDTGAASEAFPQSAILRSALHEPPRGCRNEWERPDLEHHSRCSALVVGVRWLAPGSPFGKILLARPSASYPVLRGGCSFGQNSLLQAFGRALRNPTGCWRTSAASRPEWPPGFLAFKNLDAASSVW